MLTTDYRPASFKDLVGQPTTSTVLSAIAGSGDIPASLLFRGTRGTGKTSSARVFGAALNCSEVAGDACGTCTSCVEVIEGRSTSVIEIDAASHGLVDDIRALKESVYYAHSGAFRVIVLDEAHSMSTAGFNALLKVLEEPPPGTVFILITTEPHKIPTTVTSRSMAFDFRRITALDIAKRLRHIARAESLDVPDGVLAEIAVRAQGGMRDGVMVLDQIARAGITTVEALHDLMGVVESGWDLLEAIADKDLALALKVVDTEFYDVGDVAPMVTSLAEVLASLMALKVGGDVTGLSGARLKRLQALGDRIGVHQLVKGVRVVWEVSARVGATSTDQRSTMEMAVVLLADVLGTVPTEAPKPDPPVEPDDGEDEPLSLEGMKADL